MGRLDFDDWIYHNYFCGVKVAHWKEITRYIDFKQAVKIEKQDRYKLINKSGGSRINEEQARELAEQHFKQGIKQSGLSFNAKTTPWGYSIGRQASNEILQQHNWQWDRTEILSIEFDEEFISEIQAELPLIVAAVRAAIEENNEGAYELDESL